MACDIMELQHLSPEIQQSVRTNSLLPITSNLQKATKEFEKKIIVSVLEETKFNIRHAAERLGIHRVVLHRKIRAMNIVRPTACEENAL